MVELTLFGVARTFAPYANIYISTKWQRYPHIQIIDDCVFFKYLVPRGEAYDKKYEEKLRKDDK